MKNLIYIFFVGLVLCSCSSGEDDMPVNNAPSVPALIYPANAQLCTENDITFEWSTSTDSENNTVLYRFQVAEDNQFSQGVINRQTASTQVTITLTKGQAYYWRVLAVDSNYAESEYSSIFSFFTEGDPQLNHLPFLPQFVSPIYNATVNASDAILEWTASDPDTNDTLTFDVYLDTVNPPTTMVESNLSANTLDVSSMVQAGNVYYWRVIVKDNKGGETDGQIWKFETE